MDVTKDTPCEIRAITASFFYVQTLVLNDVRLDDYEWLKEFKILRKFKIDFFRYSSPRRFSINLSDIMQNTPSTLKSLSLCNLILEYDKRHTGISNIDTLSLYLVKLPTNIDGFLSCYFPKLSTFKLKNCSQFGKSFNLSKLNLFTFRFTEYFQQDSNDIMVFTLDTNKQHRYSVKNACYDMSLIRESKPYCPSLKCLPVHGFDSNPLFFLFCNSLNNISFK